MCHVYFIDDESDLQNNNFLAQSFEFADIDAEFFPDAESALLAIQAVAFLMSSSLTFVCRAYQA